MYSLMKNVLQDTLHKTTIMHFFHFIAVLSITIKNDA